jgi:hypothetical protein
MIRHIFNKTYFVTSTDAVMFVYCQNMTDVFGLASDYIAKHHPDNGCQVTGMQDVTHLPEFYKEAKFVVDF